MKMYMLAEVFCAGEGATLEFCFRHERVYLLQALRACTKPNSARFGYALHPLYLFLTYLDTLCLRLCLWRLRRQRFARGGWA